MTNYEWIMKNWDKKIDNRYKTIGRLFTFRGCCLIITFEYCDRTGDCSQCVYTWLHSEPAKDNNFYFDNVQED